MRRWFPSEFIWRLYVVLQVAALIFATVIVLVGFANSDQSLFMYEPIYEQVDPAAVEAARAKCAHLSDDPKGLDRPRRWAFLDPGFSRREECFARERPKPRVLGQEYLGIDHDVLVRSLVFLLILFTLVFVVPFAVVRVPTWLVEGWRKDR